MNKEPTFQSLDTPDLTPVFEQPDQPVNILIVDDEAKNLTVLETILDDPSYRLVRADSAEQALLSLVAEEFALLILDIRMPSMSGFELAQMIKDRRKTARVPIIFLTAYFNEDQHVLEGYETGAVDYLHKPVNPVILRSKVAIFVELHRNNRELKAANRALVSEIAERRRAEEQLLDLNETLEQRVALRTQELSDADHRKDEFIATLAHELRNPLAPMRNAIQVLNLMVPDLPEMSSALNIIDRQVRQMIRLIDELMDIARINQGKIELKCEHIQLAEMIQLAVESTRPLIEECGHKLSVTIPPTSILINADLTRLTQVFLNLLNNAAKFSKPGGSIYLTAEPQGSDVLVSVTDAGIGIPREKLESIFEMFSQIEDAITRSRGGLGIGLSLAKRLVEMHGGSIDAKSDGPGKGSEFTVRIPIVLEQTSTVNSTDVDTSQLGSVTGLRVLVVDDNIDAARTLSMLLKLIGCVVSVGHDGAEAVKIAKEQQPEVVLLDIGLPTMNGYDAARAIRHEQWGKNMLLIAMTGWGRDEDKQNAMEAGFDRHLIKPVDPMLLMKLLSEFQMAKT